MSDQGERGRKVVGSGVARVDLHDGRPAWAAPFELDESSRLSFGEAIARVESAVRLGIDPSLEPMHAMLGELCHPEGAYRCVQVAGTNGKTSTARYTAAILESQGLSCGLYTSPHLVSYVERVEVNGAPVGEEAFAEGVSYALEAWRRVSLRRPELARGGCTEFELLTAAALVMYALARVDVAVLEVGLGGRWDATSAVDTVGCAITGIGLDHMGILGDTLGKIAGEKAAVIRSGNPCVLGTNAVRPREVLDVMLARCSEQHVTPTVVVRDGELPDALPEVRDALPRAGFEVTHRPERLGDTLEVRVGVGGREYAGIRAVAPTYQAQNIACSVALADATLPGGLDQGGLRRAVASCPIPGRFEVVRREPLVILDACHNPQSAEAFASAVIDAEPERTRRPILLFGALADKDHQGIARVVAPLFDHIVVTQSCSPRALPAEALADDVERATGARPEATVGSAAEALRQLEGKSFICCGTITLIGEIAGLMRRSASI